ncbi:hypothetical protein B0I35DRAFT_474552 [Stachybotrys elegans]|uniref:Uncharacterized protein n=1 Tax=Stachybotrys elegans TaxID=80388 RepID=A0A8K0WV58_9HYPO|nr:hypothetical protein B0I35DRAFT_474552 [Stachybotrys elegans]
MEDDGGGLFNIQISDDETEQHEEKASRRTGQSESEFQAVKRDYRIKVENGHIYEHITLPLSDDSKKAQIQEVMHAVEELYFFRRYQDAIDLVNKVLDPDQGGMVDDALRDTLTLYQSRCRQRLAAQE